LRNFISKVLFRINIVLAILLLLTYLSVFISPVYFWPGAFFGLLFPFLLILNIAFIILWAVKMKRQCLLSFIVVIAGWWLIIRYVEVRFPFHKKIETAKIDQIKVLSYNVRLFNYFKWAKESDAGNEILTYIAKESPAIICLQEFYTREKGSLTEQKILSQLKAKYSHIKYILQKPHISNYGIATFSIYPIVGQGQISFGKTFNLSIFTDLRIGSDTIRVYNNHLQSIRFVKLDYDVMDTLKLKYDQKEVRGMIDITKRLKNAFKVRAKQAEYIAAHIKTSPYPVIVCGDFNDSPVSYTYQTISKNLKDAFIEAGWGFGKTYSGIFPSYRIDYVLHDKKFKVDQYSCPKINLSDHFPILCNISKI
jgi:endonuclease/exonuclease/phosphatase family metal-dependent hydrolase